MRKPLIAVVAILAVVGALVALVPVAERLAAGRLKSELQKEGIKVESAEVGLLERRVRLVNVVGGPGAELSIGEWQASGIDWPLGELLAGRLPVTGLAWGDPLHVADFHMRAFRLGDPDEGGAWSLSELHARNLDLPRYDSAYDGPHRNQVMIARLLKALSVSSLETRELRYVSFDDVTYSMRRLVLEDYKKGRIGRSTISDLEIREARDRPPSLSVAEGVATQVDFARPLEAMSSLDWEPGMPLGRIPVDTVSLSGFGGELLARYGVSIERVSSDTKRSSAETSITRTSVEGVRIAPPMRSVETIGMRMALQAMGLREVRAAFTCDLADNREKQEVTVGDCRLQGPDLAEVSFEARASNADETFWRAIDEGDPFALLGTSAVLSSAKLVVADKGLLQRGMQAMGMMGGKGAAGARAALATEIRRFQPPGVLITQDMSTLLDTVARFVEQGGTLTLEARPQPPIGLEGLDYLTRPGADLLSALGLKATLSR